MELNNMKIKRLPKKIDPIVPEVGSKIKSAREECGLSQNELSKMLGMKSGVAVSLWESNKRTVDAIKLWQISQITDLPITYFL